MSSTAAWGARRPVLLLGLDAGDWVLMESWASRGLLPGFAALQDRVAWGWLDTPPRIMQGSVWPSIATGCNPGKHGSYFKLQLADGTYRGQRIRADYARRAPFWTYLTVPGRKIVAVDVPKVGLIQGSSAVHVVEWGTMDRYARFATHPSDLAGWLVGKFGRHPLEDVLKERRPGAAGAKLAQRLAGGVRKKAALNDALWESQQPALLFSVFGEAHAAGHYLWRDSSSGTGAAHAPSAPSNLLLDVYRELDAVVSSTYERYRDTANCVVFSGHGMQADYLPYGVLQELLERMGLSVPLAQGTQTVVNRDSAMAWFKHLLRAVPRPVRHFANKRLLPEGLQDRISEAKAFAGIDLARSRAFALPTDHQGYVRINLRGREPAGRVNFGDYDRVCAEITEELLALRCAADNAPVVESVIRTREAFPGAEHLDLLPDLCVVWRMDRPVREVISQRHGTMRCRTNELGRSANHRLEGFFFAWGPDIDVTARRIRGNALDIAPTVFALLGQASPADWDGHPLPVIRKGEGHEA